MKKKLIATIAATCLVAALGVGATLAYYTSTTEAVVNTFTIGNVKIELLEPEWKPTEGLDLVPGAEVEKDPFITNIGACAGYMMMHVTGMDEMTDMGFKVQVGSDEKGYTDGYNTAKWILVDETTGIPKAVPTDNKLVDGYYIYVGDNEGAVDAGDNTEALFDRVVFDKDKEEMAITSYQIVAKYQDAKGYFTYKDLNDNVIEANKDRVPAEKDGKVIMTYFIEGDDCADKDGYSSYEEAREHVLAAHDEEAEYAFGLSVQGFAIQSENIAFQTDGAYTWAIELATK